MSATPDPHPLVGALAGGPAGAWRGVAPGDVGYSRGGGAFGWLIRTVTKSPYAHAFIYVAYLGAGDVARHWLARAMTPWRGATRPATGVWLTVEATATGVALRQRAQAPVAVHRYWTLPLEQRRIVARAVADTNKGITYDYAQIARLAVYFLSGRRTTLPATPTTDSHICSTHVAEVMVDNVAGFGASLAEFYKRIWPCKLAREGQRFNHNADRAALAPEEADDV